MNIVINNVTKNYGEKHIFDKLSATFEENKIHAILGGSGVGKTTLLRLIAGLAEYTGSIEGCGDRISYVFQEDRLIPTLTVEKNLELVLLNEPMDKTARADAIRRVLSLMHLDGMQRMLPQELSGGMAQRVAIARALLYPSQLLLMDEPFRSLDVSLKDELITLLGAALRQMPKTVIFVTHDIYEAITFADTISVLGGTPARFSLSTQIDIPREERDAFADNMSPYKQQLYAALRA